MFSFKVLVQNKKGRVCQIDTPHGTFYTPSFYFCATHGAIKNLDMKNILSEGTTTILSNTYSLMSYSELIEQQGGIQKFMGWNRPMLTDSGGYQVFSMGYGSVAQEIKGIRNRKQSLVKIFEEQCVFKCPDTGDTKYLSPEISIDVQKRIGADFAVAFDECTPFNTTYEYTKSATERSHRWEKRSLTRFKENNCEKQRLYGIVQGGVYEDLRKLSCDFVNNHDFWGICVGGCLGQNKYQMHQITEFTMKNIESAHRPVHLLGIGDIDDIRRFVPLGIDTFDCVTPTRLARHGIALVAHNNNKFRLNLKNSIYKNDSSPIDITCLCFTCQNHSKSYLHYLIKRKELLYGNLIAIHNMRQMNDLMASIRAEILLG